MSNTNHKRKWIKRFFVFLLTLFLVLLSLVLLVSYHSGIQTYIVSKVNKELKSTVGIDITVTNVRMVPFSQLNVEGVLILDHHYDTLLYVEDISLDIDGYDLSKLVFRLDDLELSKGQVNIITYQSENKSNLSVLLDKFQTDSSSNTQFEVNIESLALNDFTLKSGQQKQTDFSDNNFNFKKFMVSELSLASNDLLFTSNTIQTQYLNFTCILNNRSDLRYNGDLSLTNNHLLSNNSELSFNNTKALLSINSDLKQMIYESDLKGNINQKDVSYFLPRIENQFIGDDLNVDLKIKGNKDSLKIEMSNVINEYVRIKGGVVLSDLSTDVSYRSSFTGVIHETAKFQELVQVKGLRTDKDFSFDLELSGKGNQLFVKGFLGDNQGKLNTQVDLIKDQLKLKLFGLLDLSEYLSISSDISMYMNNTINFDLSKKSYYSKGTIQSLRVDSLKLKGLSYAIEGDFENLIYLLDVNDRNFKLASNGSIAFGDTLSISSKNDIKRIYPSRLGLIDRDNSLRLSGSVFCNLNYHSKGSFNGFAQINNFKFKELVYRQNLDQLSLNFSQGDENYVRLFSKWINLRAKGEFSFLNIGDVLADLGSQILKGDVPIIQEKIELDCSIPRIYPIARLADLNFDGHELYVKGSLSDSTDLSIALESGRYENKSIKALEYNIKWPLHDSIQSTVYFDSLEIDKKLVMNWVKGEMDLYKQQINNKLSWDASGQKRSEGVFKFSSNLGRGVPNVKFDYGNFWVNDLEWHIEENKEITVVDDRIQIPGVSLRHLDEFFSLKGVIGSSAEDTLSFEVSHLDLETFRPLFDLINLKVDGVADGTVEINSILKNPETNSSLVINKFKLNGLNYKRLVLNSSYDTESQKVDLDAYIKVETSRHNYQPIKIQGEYYPFKETESLNAVMMLDRFKVKNISNYLSSFSSEVAGELRGNLFLKGTPSNFYLLGSLNTKRFQAKVDYLGVKLGAASEKIYFDKTGIHFKNFKLTDYNTKEAFLNGSLLHDGFTNFMFDLKLDFEEFTCLNTKKEDNDLFYGEAVATGSLTVTGSQDNVVINVNAKTDQFKNYNKQLKSSTLVIPFESASSVGSEDFLSFVHPDKENKKEEKLIQNNSGLDLKLNLEVGEEAEIKLVFDSQVGDQIRAKGNADLKLNLTSRGEFEMFGDYFVKEGDYLFTMESVINKKFKIKEGGVVSWTGDPYSGRMDLGAYYEVKTSLFDLLQYTITESQDSSLQAQRYEDLRREYGRNSIIHCVMDMDGEVMSPEIQMDLDFLDIDEKTKLTIGSMINTEDEKMKQIVSLMLWGRFLPPSQATGSGGFLNAGVSTTTNELISNQLDLWISQFSDDVDLGFNYDRANSVQERDEISLEVGKRLNDKVSFSGNFGVANRNEQSGLIGEFEVDYRLTENIRLKGFNENNDIDPSKVTGYTQGASIEYKAEFNDFHELIEPIKNFINFFKVFETKSNTVR